MIPILVIAPDNKTGATYTIMLRQLGIQSILASETLDILHILRTTPLHGILLNMPTFLRMQGEGKGIFNDVLSSFPLLRCRVDHDSTTLTVFEHGNDTPEQALARFAEQCKAAQPRAIRRIERTAATCCILLSQNPTFAPGVTERTMTINATELGLFCFSTHLWKPGATAWIQFLDLTDKTPISATVVHSVRWAKGCRIPGCGMQFSSITSEQRNELRALLHGSRSATED